MVTFKGESVTLIGEPVRLGDQAPDFNLMTTDLTTVCLADFGSQKKIISIIPSVDTGVCDMQTRTFNEEVSKLEDTIVLTVSVDLPFAQKRWCGVAGLDDAIVLSDYKERLFGKDYGVLMKEWMLLSRAVIVLDTNNTVRYVEYLDDVHSHPNYDWAIEAIKSI